MNLSCNECLKYLHCKIVNEIEELKRRKYIQLKLLDNDKSNINRLNELEDKRVKCLKKRIYLHKHYPKYVLFRDKKYQYSGDEYALYRYCGKEREYLINWSDNRNR